MAGFQRGARFQVVYSAKCRDRNVEPVGYISLGIAVFHDIEVVFLQFALQVVMRCRDFFLGNPVYVFLEFPFGKIDNRFGIDVNFSVTDFEMQVRCGGFSGVAGESDDVSGENSFANLDESFRKMPV